MYVCVCILSGHENDDWDLSIIEKVSAFFSLFISFLQFYILIIISVVNYVIPPSTYVSTTKCNIRLRKTQFSFKVFVELKYIVN